MALMGKFKKTDEYVPAVHSAALKTEVERSTESKDSNTNHQESGIHSEKVMTPSRLSDGERKGPRSMKSNSASSLNKKKIPVKIRKPTKQNIILNALKENQYDAMINLANQLEEKERAIHQLEEDIRTLKIINFRQEKALNEVSKDQAQAPKLMNSLQGDIKLLKSEKRRMQEKIQLLEKNEKSRIDELIKLQVQNERLKKQIETNQPDAINETAKRFDQLTKEHDSLKEKYEEMERKLTFSLKDKTTEAKDWKNRYSNLKFEFDKLREEHNTLYGKYLAKEKALANAEVQLQIKRTKEEQIPHMRILERPARPYTRKGLKTADTQTSKEDAEDDDEKELNVERNESSQHPHERVPSIKQTSFFKPQFTARQNESNTGRIPMPVRMTKNAAPSTIPAIGHSFVTSVQRKTMSDAGSSMYSSTVGSPTVSALSNMVSDSKTSSNLHHDYTEKYRERKNFPYDFYLPAFSNDDIFQSNTSATNKP